MVTPVMWALQLMLLSALAPVGSASSGGQSPLTNVALRKPAAQSSISANYPNLTADKAVDGNLSTYYENCPHTANGSEDKLPSRWWMVDLKGFYEIASVKITNRGDCCGDRLRDFYVQVFTVNPMKHVTAREHLCYHYSGIMPEGATELLPCSQPVTGRYLRVLKNSTTSALHMCEVQVLAKIPDSTYKLFTGSPGKRATGHLLREVTSPKDVDCAMVCATDVACNAVNLGPRTLTSGGWTRACQLLSFGGMGQPDSATPDPDWDFYNMADV